MKAISEAIEILKKRKKLHYAIIAIIFLVLYVIFFSYGYNLYFNNKSQALAIIKNVSDNNFIQITLEAFGQHNYIAGFLLILGNNIKSMAILLFSGIIFILPGFFSITQATSLGIIMGISEAIRHISFFHWIFVIVVGLLEFSTIFLACYEGTKLGLTLIKIKKKGKKKNKKLLTFNNTFIEALKIFVLIIAILTIAAAIETVGIALFGSKGSAI